MWLDYQVVVADQGIGSRQYSGFFRTILASIAAAPIITATTATPVNAANEFPAPAVSTSSITTTAIGIASVAPSVKTATCATILRV